MTNFTFINNLIYEQRYFFSTGKTRSLAFRIKQLKNLKQAIVSYETNIIDALNLDLNKPEFEGTLEKILVIQEINYALKHIQSWIKVKKIKVPINQFPASAYTYPEPLGVVLIIGSWNYPFSLILSPLVGAIAAGNCAILKPSEIAPKTSHVVANLIKKTFVRNYIAVQQGGVETSQLLLAQKFDRIFFTGGTKVGKIVMEAAAKNLSPVTLELGGKSPCLVDTKVDIKQTAKRLTWGKFLNAGQTCIAPDYLLVNRTIKENLITEIRQCIQEFYGREPATSPDYARIINDKHFEHLNELLKYGKIIAGGQTNSEERYIAPTLIENVSLESPLMQEEIFGPILPILEYTDLEEAIVLINNRPKPLVLYLFSRDKTKQKRVLQATSSGGICFNDTLLQAGISELPFGGVSDSGIGGYHGKTSFDTFSHYKSVLQKSFLFDLNWRYAPYKNKLKQMKRLLDG